MVPDENLKGKDFNTQPPSFFHRNSISPEAFAAATSVLGFCIEGTLPGSRDLPACIPKFIFIRYEKDSN